VKNKPKPEARLHINLALNSEIDGYRSYPMGHMDTCIHRFVVATTTPS